MNYKQLPWLCGLLALVAPWMEARAALQLTLPAAEATVLNRSPWVEIAGCTQIHSAEGLQAELDGQPVVLAWTRSAYRGRWQAPLPELTPGHHTISVAGRCPRWGRQLHGFDVASSAPIEPANRLAHHYISQYPASRQNWDWGPGVLLYGMDRLGKTQPEAKQYVRDYQAHWARAGAPSPDRSDSCPPALTGLALARDQDDWIGVDGTLSVADYIRFEPRNKLGSINHLGHSFFSHFYPDSIWVDSLMMMAVFATQWGDFTHDEELKAFGLAQPAIFASVLQDPGTGLFRHAWKVRSERPIPLSDTFWLRGNGWVLVSIAELLDYAPAGSAQAAQLVAIFRKTADGLIRFQQPTGLWDMIANLPGFSYPETSGSSLISYALAKGVHRGWLPPEYMRAAKSAFVGVTAMLVPESDGVSMPGISGATNPGARWLYGLVPTSKNATYGVGAYFLAASEMAREDF